MTQNWKDLAERIRRVAEQLEGGKGEGLGKGAEKTPYEKCIKKCMETDKDHRGVGRGPHERNQALSICRARCKGKRKMGRKK